MKARIRMARAEGLRPLDPPPGEALVAGAVPPLEVGFTAFILLLDALRGDDFDDFAAARAPSKSRSRSSGPPAVSATGVSSRAGRR